MKSLQLAIAEEKAFEASVLLAKYFSHSVQPEKYQAQLDAICDQLTANLARYEYESERFAQLVRFFYRDLAFSGKDKDYLASRYSLMDQVMDYRTGIPVTLAVLFCEVGKRLGFELSTIDFPGHFLIRYKTAEKRALFLDPLTGQSLDYPALEAMYFGITGEDDEDGLPSSVLQPACCKAVIVRMLYNLKAAFISEQNHHQALCAVELLISLCPDDPYERRDRGFLLAQLDCPQYARSDYQFFIKHCPHDPSAQLLKIQMRHWQEPHQVVLH